MGEQQRAGRSGGRRERSWQWVLPPFAAFFPPVFAVVQLPTLPTLPATFHEILLAVLLATVGAMVQGSIGFGLAVVSAPILLLVNPVWVPGPMLLAAMLLTFLIAHRERRQIVKSDVAIGITGRILGTLPAAYAISVLPGHAYDMLFAALILMGVLLSILGWHVAPTPGHILAAATLSGFTGTVASVGGPPMAIVYQHEKGPRVRGTMSAIFIVGTIISITGLWFAGRFGMVELLLGVIMMPGILVGFALSHFTAKIIDATHTRPAILAVSTLSAIVILVRALLQF
jgi:uncharacterized protein